MERRTYCNEITKAYLQKLGVEYVSTDGTVVICKGKQKSINVSSTAKRPYGKVTFHDPELYASVPKEERKDSSGQVDIDIHVLNYVWNTGNPRPAGMVIDHIDNDPTNNDISNLQCITHAENLAKERDNWHVWELECQLNKPRSFYEQKLEGFMMAYEQAKAMKDADWAHKLRANISQTRARLRYYDNHIEEFRAKLEAKQKKQKAVNECHTRAERRRELQHNIDSTRKFYKEALEAYGKNDEYVKKLWGEWKLAIAELYAFKEECKLQKMS